MGKILYLISLVNYTMSMMHNGIIQYIKFVFKHMFVFFVKLMYMMIDEIYFQKATKH